MDRCEHNDKVVRFCATECCAWKDAAGCSTCIKKYHSHIGPSVFVEESMIEPLLRKYKTDSSLKPKVKLLQQQLHSYFDTLKTRLIGFLDDFDRKARTELCYPYLNKRGLVNTYRQLKKRDYRKLNQKDFRIFYEATSKLDIGEYHSQERVLYDEAVIKYSGEFNRIVEALSCFEKAMEGSIIQLPSLDQIGGIKVKDMLESIESRRIVATEEARDDPEIKQEPKGSIGRIQSPQQNILFVPEQRIQMRQKSTQASEEGESSDYSRKQRELSQMKRKLLNLMATQRSNTTSLQKDSIKKTDPNISFGEKTSPSKNLPAFPVQKNHLSLEDPKNSTNSNKSINLADNFLKLPLGRQISQVKHNKLPSQDKVLLKQSPRKNTRAIVVPVKANLQIQPNDSSPLLKRKNLKMDTSIETNLKQQNGNSHQLTSAEQQSVQLLTESVKMNPQEAIPLLEKALVLAPNNLSAAEYLSFLYLQTGKSIDCLRICNSIISQLDGEVAFDINSIFIHNNKAVSLIMLGRYSQAIPLLQRCIQIKQIDRLFKNLADAFFMIGIYEKAVYYYERAVNLNGEMAEAHYNLAVCMFMQENYYNALLCAEKAVKIAPKGDGYLQLCEQIRMKM